MSKDDRGRASRPCLIVGARPIPAERVRAAVDNLGAAPFVIAADAGWRRALAAGFVPQLVVGDFDSAEKPAGDVWRQAAGAAEAVPEIVTLPAEKDDTDLHFAAGEALCRGCGPVLLAGVLGGRLDQTLASLATLLFLCRRGAGARIVDEAAEAHCVLPGETLCLARRPGVYLSVFPAEGVAKGVFEDGVKYPLEDATLNADFPLGVSNEFAGGTARISCREGGLFVLVVDKDASAF